MKLLNEDKSCSIGSTLYLESIALGDGRKLGGGHSNIFYFHPDPWGRFPF